MDIRRLLESENRFSRECEGSDDIYVCDLLNIFGSNIEEFFPNSNSCIENGSAYITIGEMLFDSSKCLMYGLVGVLIDRKSRGLLRKSGLARTFG